MERLTFQLTASQGGWLQVNSENARLLVFQLTASQGGWREIVLLCKAHGLISTHSLTRRLTLNNFPMILDDSFQLTASQGGWQIWDILINGCFSISTHSLTRRLTLSTLFSIVHQAYFNSQPHKEADGKLALNPMVFEPFQLTASQGGWRR